MSTHEPDHDDGFLERFLSSAFSVAEPDAADAMDADDAAAHEADRDEPIPARVGRFLVQDVLGEGGSGRVLRAHDPALGRDVALKVVRASLASDQAACERFVAEAHVCAGLQHPGIVPIHEFGRLEDGRPYFAMKIVEGQTFAELMRGATRGAAARGFVEIFEKVCQTLAFVHAHGVLHGDLKPHNVMVGAFGEVQVMDFGFARHAAPGLGTSAPATPITPIATRPWNVERAGDSSAEGSSSRIRIGGTLAYMAPEQARGDDVAVTTRTDVFGLGAMLCEILTGKPPYRANTRAELMLQASKGWLDDARERLTRCDAEPELVELAIACLAVDPAARPVDAKAVAAAVSAHLRSLAKRARDAELEAEKARAVAAHEARSRRLTLALSLAVLVAVVVPATLMLFAAHERDERRGTAEHAVGAALERARLLAADARQASVDVDSAWDKAFEAAHAATALAAGPDVGEQTRATALDLENGVGRERDDAAAKARIVARLAELRPHGRVDAPAALDAKYRAAFAEFGIDLGASEPEAAARVIREDRARDVLVDGLDDWAWLQRRHGVHDARAWIATIELALRADDDALRSRVRRAVLENAPKRLLEIAGEAGLAVAPARSLVLLARALAETNQREDAIRVYRVASFRHPDDVHLSHDLAAQLGLLEDPPLGEITRLYSMALAARPDDAHILTDLGRALLLRGERANAVTVMERAAALAPDDARAHMLLGIALAQLGRVEDALTPLARAVELGQSVAVVNLEDSYVRLGRVDEARAAVRVAAVKATDPAIVLHCGVRSMQMRDFETCKTAIDRTLSALPDHAGALQLKATLALENGKNGEAKALLEHLRESSPRAALTDAAREMQFTRLVDESVAAQAEIEVQPEPDFDAMNAYDIGVRSVVAFRIGRIEWAARGFAALEGRAWKPDAVSGFHPAAALACAQYAAQVPASERAEWNARAVAYVVAAVDELTQSVESDSLEVRDAIRALDVVARSADVVTAREALPSGDAAGKAMDDAVAEAMAKFVDEACRVDA
ncbi:MAG: protein kinase [Planctomycetes bacterium]|nr:protein kinase [Planctomycetota bacterium]